MDFHTGDRVLLEAHSWNEKTVDHILRSQMQVHAVTDGNNHRRRENVIATGRIAWIDAQGIAFISFGKLLCVGSTKHSVSSGVAEIPLELRSRDLNLDLTSLVLRGHYA